jgi:hypothetical protein
VVKVLRKVGNVCKGEDRWKRAVRMRLDIEAWGLMCCILSRNIARMLFTILEMKKSLQGYVTRGGESGKFGFKQKVYDFDNYFVETSLIFFINNDVGCEEARVVFMMHGGWDGG